jgi:hypothetical protein
MRGLRGGKSVNMRSQYLGRMGCAVGTDSLDHANAAEGISGEPGEIAFQLISAESAVPLPSQDGLSFRLRFKIDPHD